jgi:2-polyprenyl-3-methyl-5-hydroxy-6-metoxy-1,4-benzoquinol methylase
MAEYLPSNAATILDVGCGDGSFSAGLKSNRELEVWGIEIDELAAAEAVNKLDRVLVGDAIALVNELPDNHFDCIYCNDILEHLIDPEKLLEILKSKLKSDGRLVASIPNVRYFWNIVDLVFYGKWNYTDEGILDRTHLRFFTKKSMQKMFTNNGYEVISIDGIHPTQSLKFKLFNLKTLGFFREMQYLQFALVLQKG